MVIKLMILDSDSEYLRRFFSWVEWMHQGDFILYPLSDPACAIEIVHRSNINILLVRESFAIDPAMLPEGCMLVTLVDEIDDPKWRGKDVVHRQAGYDVILSSLRERYQNNCAQESASCERENDWKPDRNMEYSDSRKVLHRKISVLDHESRLDRMCRKMAMDSESLCECSSMVRDLEKKGRIEWNAEYGEENEYYAGDESRERDYRRYWGGDEADPKPRGFESPKAGVDGAERKYLQLLERLKGKKKPAIDDVRFRCAALMTIEPGQYFIARIIMTRDGDSERARELARELAGEQGDEVRMASGSLVEAEKGQEFTLRLQSPDLPELDEMDQISWNGKYAFKDFEILLPGNYDRKQLRLLGRVYSHEASVPVTDIKLILEVNCPTPQVVSCENLHLRTAFVSYSSKDRPEVAKRLQMLERVRPDMEVFMDRLSLRRGEEYEPRLYREIQDRDLFFLFWSRNAADSEWVKKELAYAMEHKPVTHIEPIWLEKIEDCPPPEGLQHLHFWDWTQHYL